MSVTKNCEYCGKLFTVIPSRNKTAKFCCRKCADASKKGENNVICTNCGKPFHRKKYYIESCKRNIGIFCSKECLKEYKKE